MAAVPAAALSGRENFAFCPRVQGVKEAAAEEEGEEGSPAPLSPAPLRGPGAGGRPLEAPPGSSAAARSEQRHRLPGRGTHTPRTRPPGSPGSLLLGSSVC